MDVAILILIAAVVFLLLRALGKRGKRPRLLYRQRSRLFTAAERSFLGVLDQAVAGTYRVFGKVRVADVLAPERGLDRNRYFSLLNRITAKHFDYVLCDPATLEVKAVVELNDKSHKRRSRVERDEFIEDACASAGLPLVFVTAQRSYSVAVIRDFLRDIEIDGHDGRGVDEEVRV